MFQRSITVDHVKEALKNAEVIAEYPDDKPYPSFLLLGHIGKNPCHLVIATDRSIEDCIIVTVYRPSLIHWEKDFKTPKPL